ncbi:MAG: hypothetical protein ACPG4Q_01375 [Phycisphaeraceae bacterium]
MHSGTTGQGNLATVTMQLATKAIEMASDTSPHRAPEGERRWSLANMLPAARVLIGQGREADRDVIEELAWGLTDTINSPWGRVTDGFGHTRPIYAWFAIYQLGTAAWSIGDHGAVAMLADAVERLFKHSSASSDSEPRLAAWHHLLASFHGISYEAPLPPSTDEPAPLMPLGVNDLIDAWTYRELVGLHGLYLHGLLRSDADRLHRAQQAATYHLGHTQPDYTTYQPWGLAAFAADPMTAVFAEQQLHDVATHLSIEGPGGAVMPALLLADSAAAMSGTLTQIWR